MEPLRLQISTNLGKNQKNKGDTNHKPVQGKLEKEQPPRITTNRRSTTNQPEANEGGELIDKAENQPFRPLQRRRPQDRKATVTETGRSRATVATREEGVNSLNVAQNGGAEQKTHRTTTGMLTS
ncbi:hypothetical protein QL285_004837 [Trifolium repens]|nr:hypothetical protein QL285_004837 [Trifolium repens]